MSAREFAAQLADKLAARPPVEDPRIADYEQQIEDLTQRLNNACVDVVEVRAQRAHLAKELEAVTITVGSITRSLKRAINERETALDMVAKVLAEAVRYRLAWLSARRRANGLTRLFLHWEAAHDRVAADLRELRQFHDTHSRHLDGRLTAALAERDEARAEVVRLGKVLDDATDWLRSALAEQRIEPL